MQTIEHISAEAMERYRARHSAPSETLSVQAHVSKCEMCRRKLAQAIDAGGAFAALRDDFAFDFGDEPEHLPYEQLALFVDGKLDEVDREIAESHLAICDECLKDAADLRLFRKIAAESAAPVALAQTEKRPSWQRLFSFDLFGGVPAAAGAFAILIAVLFAVWFFAKSNQSNPENQLVQTNANRNSITPSPQPSAFDNTQNNRTNNSTQTPDNSAPNIQPTSSPVAPKMQPTLAPQPRTNEAPVNAPLLALNDGGKTVAINAEGQLSGAENLPDSVRDAVRRSLKSQRVQVPRALDAIKNAQSGILMSGSPEETNGVPFALVSPVGKITRETQPVLRWRALPDARHYVVAVVDSSFRVVAESSPLTATEWKIDKPLSRGANYSWQVTAVRTDGSETVSPSSPAPAARFRTMEQAAFDDVTRIETTGVKSHLARGVIYAQAGLINEARAEFNVLVKQNPRSQLALRLLESVRKK